MSDDIDTEVVVVERYFARSLKDLRTMDERGLRSAESRAKEQTTRIHAQLKTDRAVRDPAWSDRVTSALTWWEGQQGLIDAVRHEREVDSDALTHHYRRLAARVGEHLYDDTRDTLEGVRVAYEALNDYLERPQDGTD